MSKPSFVILSFFVGLSLLVATILIYNGIQLSGYRSLDFIFTINGLQNAISGYSENDIARHKFMTTTLDSALPLLYTTAILFAVMRYIHGKIKILLSLAVIAAAGFDYAENYLNIKLLTGSDVYQLHAILTWCKFGLLIVPMLWGLKLYIQELFSKSG